MLADEVLRAAIGTNDMNRETRVKKVLVWSGVCARDAQSVINEYAVLEPYLTAHRMNPALALTAIVSGKSCNSPDAVNATLSAADETGLSCLTPDDQEVFMAFTRCFNLALLQGYFKPGAGGAEEKCRERLKTVFPSAI